MPLTEKLQSRLQDGKRGPAPQGLALAPVKELANQVNKDFSDITKKKACFYGGIDLLAGT